MLRLVLPLPGPDTLRRGITRSQRYSSSLLRQRSSDSAAATRARGRTIIGIDAVAAVVVAAASNPPSSSVSRAAPGDSRLSSEDFDTIQVSVVTKNTESREFSLRNRAAAAGSDDAIDDSFDASSSSVVDVDLDDEDEDAFALEDEDDERNFVLRDDFVDFNEFEEEEDDSSKPAAGPRCVLLAGFADGEAAAVRALVDVAGFPSAAVLPAQGAGDLSLTVRDAILGGGVKEPDWSSPKEEEDEGKGKVKRRDPVSLCRAVLFGGLTPREQARVADALESAGLPRFAVAEAHEEEWKTRRVGDVLAEAAAEQGLLLFAASSSTSKKAREQKKKAATASPSTSPPAAVTSTASPDHVVDALPDVEEMIRRAERELGGKITTVEMRGPSVASSQFGAGEEERGADVSLDPSETPAWHAEASSAGPALLDSLRDNVVVVGKKRAGDDDDDDVETSAEATEQPELLLDAVITGASAATQTTEGEGGVGDEGKAEDEGEEQATDPLSSYLAAATAADPGRLPRTSNSPTFSLSERASGGSSSGSDKEGGRPEAEAEEAATAAAAAAATTTPSPKPAPVTIAPIGLEGEEEVALHDRLSKELDAKFRAMPASDKEALRNKMREEAREPTRDAIVAAVACGLSFDEIVGMAKVASEAAKEAESGLGVPWGDLAKADLDPSEEELRSAAAVKGGEE